MSPFSAVPIQVPIVLALTAARPVVATRPILDADGIDAKAGQQAQQLLANEFNIETAREGQMASGYSRCGCKDSPKEGCMAVGSTVSDMPDAQDPEKVHVALASDLNYLDGTVATVSSLLNFSAAPSKIVVHLIVQPKFARDFRCRFGMGACNTKRTAAGALIVLHLLDDEIIAKIPVQTVGESAKAYQSASVETYVRAFFHLWLPEGVMIWIDVDTVVQGDVAVLKKELLDSEKSIAFVERVPDWKHVRDYVNETEARVSAPFLLDKLDLTEYNAGVLAIDTKRWAAKGYHKTFVYWLHRNTELEGRLFVGNDQTALALTFFDQTAKVDGQARREPDDFTVVSRWWNCEVTHQGFCKQMWSNNISPEVCAERGGVWKVDAEELRKAYAVSSDGHMRRHRGYCRDMWSDKINLTVCAELSSVWEVDRDKLRKAYILHFDTHVKPWMDGDQPGASEFWQPQFDNFFQVICPGLEGSSMG